MIKYFAKLGLNSKVIEVCTVHENNAPTEKQGIEFLNKWHSYPFWAQTFKDQSQRKHYASPGMTYDEDRDAFIPKKLYTSWVLNENTCKWEAPVAYPADGSVDKRYDWNESTTSWEEAI